MAVIFAIAGAGAVYAAVNSDPYSDHSDYSNYSNHSNYSDAAERRKRRLAAKQEEVNQVVSEVNQYKINRVNTYLENENLINTSGEIVSVNAVKIDGDRHLDHEQSDQIKKETKDIEQEIAEIDAAISAINQILGENKT